MSLFLILLGGELTVTPRLKRQISGARVIAADSGMKHAEALGVEAELWIGDFDSSDAALLERYADVPRITFPPDKAQTDGDLAIDEALSRGATRLILAGALGGPRSDHAAHHQMKMLALALSGIDVFLTSGSEEAWPLLPGGREFDFPNGTIFSVNVFDDLKSLTISGARWPLCSQDIKFGSSMTVSNQTLDVLNISMGKGKAAVFAVVAER